MPPTTLYLARHGQSEWNNQSLITGQTDVGLSDKGRQQGQALADCLRGLPLDTIIASTLRRTADTAAATAKDKRLSIQTLSGLNEIRLGPLEGRRRDDSDPEAKALWAQWQADLWGFCMPGAEAFGDFAARVNTTLDTILQHHTGQHVLLVGHRATNRVIMGRLLAWPRERWVEIRLRNKYFYSLELEATPARVRSHVLSGSKTGTSVDGLVM